MRKRTKPGKTKAVLPKLSTILRELNRAELRINQKNVSQKISIKLNCSFKGSVLVNEKIEPTFDQGTKLKFADEDIISQNSCALAGKFIENRGMQTMSWMVLTNPQRQGVADDLFQLINYKYKARLDAIVTAVAVLIEFFNSAELAREVENELRESYFGSYFFILN